MDVARLKKTLRAFTRNGRKMHTRKQEFNQLLKNPTAVNMIRKNPTLVHHLQNTQGNVRTNDTKKRSRDSLSSSHTRKRFRVKSDSL